MGVTRDSALPYLWSSELSLNSSGTKVLKRNGRKPSSNPEEVVHAHNVIAFFVWAWPSGLWLKLFPLVSYFMKRHCLVLPGGSTPRTLIPVWTLPLRHISSSLSVARPFTNGVEWGWKKCTDPMVGGARSITLYDACTPSSGSNHIKYQCPVGGGGGGGGGGGRKKYTLD